MLFRYFLSNEGLGPALNVEHGVSIGDREFPFGGDPGMQFTTIRAHEFLPALDHGAVDPIPSRCISLPIKLVDCEGSPPVYWCRFESVFGEKWDTRNPTDPTQPAELTAVDNASTRRRLPSRIR